MDQTPPRLVASLPETGAVNVAAETLVLEFSERVDEATAGRALTVAPAFSEPPEVRVRGRRVEVRFPDTLRAQTTYVVTLGTDLQDAHGVALDRPITLAFATGAQLDRGRLAGRLLDPATGRGLGGLAVFAYRLADSTAAPPNPAATAPDYRTEAATDGAFRFDYLREGPYFVAAVEDRNRNARADDGERFAPPPSLAALAFAPDSARSDSLAAPLSLFVTARDTTPPVLRRTRALSDRRFALRFDEPVILLDMDGWTVADSADGPPVQAVAFRRDINPTEIIVLLDAPRPPRTQRLAGIIADSSGNTVAVETFAMPSAASDTAQVRFEGFLPPSRAAADSVFLLRPDAAPGVRFSQPLDSLAFRSRVTVRGPSGPLPFETERRGGVRYRLRLSEALGSFRVEVEDDDSTYVRRYAVSGPDALGAILGRVEAPASGDVLVAAYPEGAAEPFVARAEPDGAFVLRRLPPGTYRLRLVLDRDGDGQWSGGSLAPYAPPEPIRWLPEPVRVRARWESELEAPLTFSLETIGGPEE